MMEYGFLRSIAHRRPPSLHTPPHALILTLLSHTPAGRPEDFDDSSRRTNEASIRKLEGIFSDVKWMGATAAGGRSVEPAKTARALYHLGKRAGELRGRRRGDEQTEQRNSAAQCLQQLLQLLLAEVAGTEGAAVLAFHKLSKKDTALSVWAVDQLQRASVPGAMAAMQAMLQHAEFSPAIAQAGWADWSRLLYAARKSGLDAGNGCLHRLFDQAFSRLPGLLDAGEYATAQDISNLLYAAAVARYNGPLVQPLVAAVVQAVRDGRAMGDDAVPQSWANSLWGLARLEVRGSCPAFCSVRSFLLLLSQ